MGLNFRKSFKIAPGVKLNVSKKGISSVSAGVKGARVSVGKKGTRTTVGIPGTGLSYSKQNSYKKSDYDMYDGAWTLFKAILWIAGIIMVIGLFIIL